MKVGNAHHKPHMEEYPCDSARYVIDPYMGLSQDLISALHRVTRLSGFPVCEESQQVALQCEIMSMCANSPAGPGATTNSLIESR